MDFPFSLNVDKSFPDLNLGDGRVSEFFLKSINSLSAPAPSMDTALVPSSGTAGEKLIPDLPATESRMMAKDKTIPKVDGTAGVEGVKAIPAVERRNTVERVNTVDGGDTDEVKEVKVAGVERVKERTEMDTSCTGDKSSENNLGKKDYFTWLKPVHFTHPFLSNPSILFNTQHTVYRGWLERPL